MGLLHLPSRRPGGAVPPPQRTTSPTPTARSAGDTDPGPSKVLAVHRVGAVVVAGVVLTFGLLGFAGGLAFFSTSGEPVLGMSSNGLLSSVSVATALLLITAAVRGPRIASTVMVVVGSLFLLSGLLHLAVLRTSFNVLAFEMTNVIFSFVSGLTLLVLGAYGRFTGNLPPDSPYARPGREPESGPAESWPSTPAEFAAERAMREAEIAVVNRVATADQRRRVEAMARCRTRLERRQVWMGFDAPGA